MATLLELRTRMFNRFDEGQLNYVSVAEANTLLNEGAAHLHNWIVNSAEFYIWSEAIIPLVSGQMDYNLPTDFYKALKVFVLSGTAPAYRYDPMNRVMPEEFRGNSTGLYGFFTDASQGYMIVGNKIRVMPVPAGAAGNIAIWYAPTYKPMVLDTDTPSISVAPGWEEFLVNHAVINCRIKEESDTTQLERRQAVITKMIEEALINRDMGRHQHVVDIDKGV
jgi:hypothetical protein